MASCILSGNLELSRKDIGSCSFVIPRWLRFDPSNKKGLIIKGGTSIRKEDGSYETYHEDTHINLSSYVSSAGKDYFVYLDNNGNITAYNSKQTTKGVQIGRFHTLCVDSGTIAAKYSAQPSSGISVGAKYLVKPYNQQIDPDFYNLYNITVSAVSVQSKYDVVTGNHPLSGYAAGDILPESVFCLSFYPDSLVEDGMVYDKGTDKCVDIYLQSGTGINTRSIYNATHTVSREPINHQADMMTVGKKLLIDNDFLSCAIGSNEATNITGSSDKTIVGGHIDTDGRRMISAVGCEECCGYLWQWLDELGFNGQTGWSTYDSHASFGQSHGVPYVLSAGGNWNNSSYCGSRSRNCNNSRSNVNDNYGARSSICENYDTKLLSGT